MMTETTDPDVPDWRSDPLENTPIVRRESPTKTTPERFGHVEITPDDHPTIVTHGNLAKWRIRRAELDKLLGDAGREAKDLDRKIHAAEFLIGCKAQERPDD